MGLTTSVYNRSNDTTQSLHGLSSATKEKYR